jgi:hypothetical protein
MPLPALDDAFLDQGAERCTVPRLNGVSRVSSISVGSLSPDVQ